MTAKPAYKVHFDEVPEMLIPPADPSNKAPFRARMIHGAQASLMLADRGPGYHTKPHIHDAEQWNYIISGEIWFFVEEHGYLCRTGDVMRIPRNRPHWAWNRSPGHTIVFECHAPGLVADDPEDKRIVWLLGSDEKKGIEHVARNHYIDFNQAQVDVIEERATKEEQQGPTK